MTREELNERRSDVRRRIAELNAARMRDLRDEKMRHVGARADEDALHAQKVSEVEEAFQLRMAELRDERDWLSQEVADDEQEGGEA